jgi:type I restriction enzyme M protein
MVSLATMNLTLRDLSLPGRVFHPYLGVKTSVLLFRKDGRTERVLFLHADADGYKLDSNHDTPGEIGDLPGLVKAYQSRLGSLAAWPRGSSASPRSAGPRIGGARPRTSCATAFILSAPRWRPRARKAVERRDPLELPYELRASETEIAE